MIKTYGVKDGRYEKICLSWKYRVAPVGAQRAKCISESNRCCFTPNMYVVQVLRKLVGMEQSNDLVIHVAMDNALILRYSSRKKNVGFFPMHCNPSRPHIAARDPQQISQHSTSLHSLLLAHLFPTTNTEHIYIHIYSFMIHRNAENS